MASPRILRSFLAVLIPLAALSCATTSPVVPTDEGSQTSSARSRAQELVTGVNPESSGTASGTGNAVAAAPAGDESSGEAAAAPVAADVSAADQQFLESYLKRIKYLVTIKTGALSEFQASSVATKANEYLLKQGFDVVQYEQLLKNVEDQRTAYEAEVGEGVSLIQYIAQKLGADIYVELDAVPRSSTDGGKHYGSANFTASIFDPSTAELLGAVTFTTDRSFSTASEDDAIMNALVAGTAQLMPRVVRDSVSTLRNRYANGIRYQVIVQKTPDARAVSALRRSLRPRVREIVMGASSADQTTMDVYLFGSISDLEDACYGAFERTPGFESAYWVYTRGKTITFNSGN